MICGLSTWREHCGYARGLTWRRLQIVIGVLIAAFAVYLIFSPHLVATTLHRPAATSSQRINLRASWGGLLLGLGGFVAWLPKLRPFHPTLLGLLVIELLVWVMAGIASARVLGFVLDGHPDTLQWIWITAEVAIVIVGVVVLRRRRK